MKKLYQEFFCIPEQGKVSDKVLLVRMAAAAVFMVLCLCGMSASAYAYFTCSVSSASNVIQTGQFTAEVDIKCDTDASIDPITKVIGGALEAERLLSVDLAAGKHTVELNPKAKNPTGFFIIKAGGKEYYTRQLVEDGTIKPLTFTLELSQDAKVEFLAHWGTYTGTPIVNSENNTVMPFKEWSPQTTQIADVDDSLEGETPPADVQQHTVQSGETLDTIAAQYGITLDLILAYNEIADAGSIKEGDVLKIPPADWKPDVKTEEPAQQTGQMATNTPAAGLNQESGENKEQQEEQPDNGTSTGTDNTNTGDAT